MRFDPDAGTAPSVAVLHLQQTEGDMDTLPPDLTSLLATLRTELEDLYGDRLVELVLYGSQARGDTHEESDVDVLVVLDGRVTPGTEIRRMSDLLFQIGMDHEVYISALPVSRAEYRSAPSTWLKNVQNEGVSL